MSELFNSIQGNLHKVYFFNGKNESKQVGSICVCHVSYMGRKNQNKLVACVCLPCVLHGKKKSKQVGSMCVFVMCLTWEERIKTSW